MSGRSSKPGAAVLISGNGSNLQALIDAMAANELGLDIVLVISNRHDAFGLQRAREAGIATVCLDDREFGDRERYDAALSAALDAHGPDYLLLAGFMRILGDAFVRRYAGRMLNIHPSLLPDYRGLHTHRRVVAAGETTHGCTVHFVTAELDGGPLVAQGRIAVQPGETADILAARVLAIEHLIYPLATQLLAAGRIRCDGRRAYLDGELLERPLILGDGKLAPA